MSNDCQTKTAASNACGTPTTRPFEPSADFKRVPVPGEELHACMGLNNCAGQDRYGMDGAPGFAPNDCAGQGYCATTQMHSCHTNNNCANQGGCGLYGSESELNRPGANACRSMGSCATPINAERFITTGAYRGTSVWHRARAVFKESFDPSKATKGHTPQSPKDAPSEFPDGPTYAWITTMPEGEQSSFAACGSSGMSGGGSCG
ncbi:hypothetical protein [uncultured Tateyamaria sp.]|uniref:hypothetical protein n=1 Tax=uncultured Tateyamaria sp. TaxID=455651 RepID=UPI0026172BF1|nr:hypothetical protein [uncultured Tateyamaria sp.]